MSSDPRTATHRPTLLSGVFAVVVAAIGVSLLEPTGATHAGLLVEAVGLALLGGGLVLVHRDRPVFGVPLAGIGTLVVLGSLVVPLSGSFDFVTALELLPGMVGVALLALGLAPLRGDGSRGLVKAGTALVFLSVIASGLFQDATRGTLLVSAVTTVIAWDAGENAISLGEQLGRAAETKRIEAVHVGATVLVGILAVAGGNVVSGVGSTGLPLASLVLLLVAVAVLSVALHD